MHSTRIVLLIVLLFNFSGSIVKGQTSLLAQKEINLLIKQANNYRVSGNIEKSLYITRVALRKAIAINDNELIARNYNSVAANYNELMEFDKAIFFYEKALVFANLSNNDDIKEKITNNLGNMYCFEKKQYKKGIDYYKKALEYSKKIQDSSQMALTNLNITWAYFDNGRYNEGKKSLAFLNKYHDTNSYTNNSTIVIMNMLNGIYYSYINDKVKAESYFQEAIRLGIKLNEKSDLSYSYLEYSKFLLKEKKYKKAYEYLALYDKLTEEMYIGVKSVKANIEGVNFELDEYKRTIDKIESEKESQYKSLKKSRIIVLLFIIVFFVLLLFLNSLIKNNRYRTKYNLDLVRANEELIIANKKAEESSVLKTQFISTISHELRTPLYGVVGITDLLLEEHKELISSPHLNSLKFSARYLLSLVNDILQINKIEENKIVLEYLTFNMLDELNMIKNSLSFIAKKNNNQIFIEVDPIIPENLIGDKLRLAQILMNLVSNALKFTNNGEVHVTVKQVKVKDNRHTLEFNIKDNGIGIASIDQAKIFDKFVQVGRKEIDYQGTGLGLSIVKRLLDLFDSDISVESELGKGSTFTFSIDFEYDMIKTVEIINNIKVDLTSSQVFNVLVVEDNHINQVITKKTMERNNFSCTVVEDGYLAIELLKTEKFDVILMDINMPLINGFETTRKIRKNGILTPVIALTAFDKNEVTDEAITSGMNDIIVKPYESVQLFKIIQSHIQKTKSVD